MAILNDAELLEDSIEVLVEALEIPRDKAVQVLNDETMGRIVSSMWQAQEAYLQEIGIEIRREEKKKWESAHQKNS